MTCEQLRDEYELHALGLSEIPERWEIENHLSNGCSNCRSGIRNASADQRDDPADGAGGGGAARSAQACPGLVGERQSGPGSGAPSGQPLRRRWRSAYYGLGNENRRRLRTPLKPGKLWRF